MVFFSEMLYDNRNRCRINTGMEIAMKKILFAASECVPFIKTGGLADVCGALPKEFDKNESSKFQIQCIII